jgi:hypothetical protein
LSPPEVTHTFCYFRFYLSPPEVTHAFVILDFICLLQKLHILLLF